MSLNIFSSISEQRGASLVEMMIASTIGLIILISLAYFFIGSKNVSRTFHDLTSMQDSGRNALEIIGKSLRQAGALNDTNIIINERFKGVAIVGEDNTNAPDTLTVQYEAQTGGETGCDGTFVALGVMTFAFTVQDNALRCNGVVVVENVEDMQVSYGLDPEKDGVIQEYKSNPSALELAQVVAVRVNLLVRGESNKAAAGGSQKYSFNNEDLTSADGYLRQQYSATYAMRNYSW